MLRVNQWHMIQALWFYVTILNSLSVCFYSDVKHIFYRKTVVLVTCTHFLQVYSIFLGHNVQFNYMH